MDRLYVITRADLAPGAQLAQACHAVSAFAVANPEQHLEWHTHGQNLVVLAAGDEHKLSRLLDALEDAHGQKCAAFFEPDFGGRLTAFAVSDAAGKLLSSLPLALRGPRLATAA
jgi:hypothetical protein